MDRYAGDLRFEEDGRERPSIQHGTFHLGKRPVFFLGPWIYNHTDGDWPPGNPNPQGIGHFAYQELPGRDVFERMGFNASQLSAAWHLPGQTLYGLDVPIDAERQDAEKTAFFRRFGDQPMVVDFAFGFARALGGQTRGGVLQRDARRRERPVRAMGESASRRRNSRHRTRFRA